jgi:hypothetical protein
MRSTNRRQALIRAQRKWSDQHCPPHDKLDPVGSEPLDVLEGLRHAFARKPVERPNHLLVSEESESQLRKVGRWTQQKSSAVNTQGGAGCSRFRTAREILTKNSMNCLLSAAFGCFA